ncbi:hypothetical protein [Burkholderia plantarii]|uniref:hypothetical protein n=1 Tax=Burkholderia plantarii TaxID=41899 RepID=UPI0018DC9B16|nr:hypothetical protein [Burkholderia plantarii]MBI0326977.1 hypothetical protein [Burkholderia plantarii]
MSTTFDGLTKMELISLLGTAPGNYQLTPEQVSALLNRSVKQLADDRTAQRGPTWKTPWGPNGSIRYPIESLRKFFEDQPTYSSTHESKLAAERGALAFGTLDDMLTPGQRLENLAGPGVLTVPLSSVVDVLGGLGRYAAQNARDALRRGLPDLRSRRVGGVRHVPVNAMAGWLDSLDGVATGEPEPAAPVSPLRAQRLGYVGRAHVELLDGALGAWQVADQAREAAELRAIIDAENGEPLPGRTGPRGP